MSEHIGADAPTEPDLVKDASIESFEQDVLTASMTVPVIVDFWAEWCGPCKQLAPALEKAVAVTQGKVRLVKVDIDKNQMLASQLRIQSIPTVFAFFQGRPVDGFQGAVPESEIKAFIDRLTKLSADGGAPPSAPGAASDGVEDYINAGQAAFDEGDVAAAAQLFAQALQAEPENIAAIVGLARCHLSMGDNEKARQTIDLAPTDKKGDPALERVNAALLLAEAGGEGGDIPALRASVEGAPDNLEARLELADAHIAAGDLEAAIEDLLAIIERDRDWNEGAARKKLLTVFDALGGGHQSTMRGRRRLSSILFS